MRDPVTPYAGAGVTLHVTVTVTPGARLRLTVGLPARGAAAGRRATVARSLLPREVNP
jgi:hypothetical protein